MVWPRGFAELYDRVAALYEVFPVEYPREWLTFGHEMEEFYDTHAIVNPCAPAVMDPQEVREGGTRLAHLADAPAVAPAVCGQLAEAVATARGAGIQPARLAGLVTAIAEGVTWRPVEDVYGADRDSEASALGAVAVAMLGGERFYHPVAQTGSREMCLFLISAGVSLAVNRGPYGRHWILPLTPAQWGGRVTKAWVPQRLVVPPDRPPKLVGLNPRTTDWCEIRTGASPLLALSVGMRRDGGPFTVVTAPGDSGGGSPAR